MLRVVLPARSVGGYTAELSLNRIRHRGLVDHRAQYIIGFDMTCLLVEFQHQEDFRLVVTRIVAIQSQNGQKLSAERELSVLLGVPQCLLGGSVPRPLV